MLSDQFLSHEAERLRWFLLPSEAQDYLINEVTPPTTPPLFIPKSYSNNKTESLLDGKVNDKEKDMKEKEEEEGKDEKKTVKFHNPPKSILKPSLEVRRHYDHYNDINNGYSGTSLLY